MPTWLGAKAPELLLAMLLGTVALGLLWALRGIARRQYRRYARTAEAELLEIPLQVASRTTWTFMIVASYCGGLAAVDFGAHSESLVGKTFAVVLFWQAGVWATTAVGAWLDRRRKIAIEADKAAAGSIGIIRFIARVAIWAMVVLLTLDNLGFDITALIAGLGIGGIAVALAVQNVLGDLFASLSIALDQPFVIGDFLVVGEHMGSVEYIGIKSTRLRSLSGEQIVMSNADLLGGRLRNFGRMQERRIAFTVGVTYDTDLDLVKKVVKQVSREIMADPELAKNIIQPLKSQGVAAMGDFAIQVRMKFMAKPGEQFIVRRVIYDKIKKAFDANGIKFAFPTVTVAGGEQDQLAAVARQALAMGKPAAG